MKFFHISDLHIGLKLMNRDMCIDQEYILKQIIDRAVEQKPEAMVIAGDIYDKSIPSIEAVEIFNHFISDLTKKLPEMVIMIISGNHDSAVRLNCFRSILSRQNIYMIGMPPQTQEEYIEKVILQDRYGKINFYLLPFVKPSMVKEVVGVDKKGNHLSYQESIKKLIKRENINFLERNILVSHQFFIPTGKNPEQVERMDSEILTIGNIDAISTDILTGFDYVALGHIHKPMYVGNQRYYYCGTPLAYSISEAGQQKSICMVDIREKENISILSLPLVPLHQVAVVKGSLEEILKQACEDYITVVLTDMEKIHTIDIQDRIRKAFPNLLEIRRENIREAEYHSSYMETENFSPFALCCDFLKDIDEEEKEILQDIIHMIQGV